MFWRVTARDKHPSSLWWQGKRSRLCGGTRKESMSLKGELRSSSRDKVTGNQTPGCICYALLTCFRRILRVLFAGEQYERAKRLQDKMICNLTMAKDRLALLGKWELGCLAS